jgi:hypothetical protein
VLQLGGLNIVIATYTAAAAIPTALAAATRPFIRLNIHCL